MYLNKVLLYGNLTRDPEIKALPGGQQVVSFALATNRSFKDKDGAQKDQTEFHNIVAFGRTAEVMGQYLKKGRPAYLEGRIQTRSWETDGKKNYRTEVVVDSFQFGPQAQGGSNTGGYEPATATKETPSMPEMHGGTSQAGEAIAYPDDEINPEDIPF
jgi:single-strand DNA-binding protein